MVLRCRVLLYNFHTIAILLIHRDAIRNCVINGALRFSLLSAEAYATATQQSINTNSECPKSISQLSAIQQHKFTRQNKSVKMFKLAVFVAMVVVCQAAPKPGFLHHDFAYPVATSHSSRIDIHSKPIVVAAAPAIVHAPIIHAPIVKAYAPIVKTIIPAAVSHSSRYDVHSAPLVSYGHGYGHGYYGHGLGYGHGYGLGYGHHGLYGHYGHY